MDAATIRAFRTCARQWRAGSKARAAKLGRQLELPSIDVVHQALLRRARFCTYCQAPVDFTKRRRLNLDHAVPLSRGGDASVENMLIACGRCNRSKGDLNQSEYRALLALLNTWEDRGKSVLTRLRLGFYR